MSLIKSECEGASIATKETTHKEVEKEVKELGKCGERREE